MTLLINNTTLNKSNLKIALIGARIDGQAGVVLDVLTYYSNIEVVAFFDNRVVSKGATIQGIPIIGDIDKFSKFDNSKIDAIHVSIGDNKARYDIYKKLKPNGIPFISVIHPTAVISSSAKIGKGCFIGANATIQNNSIIGDYTIINTGTIVEHDNVIGDAVHMAPGSCTSGRVKIRDLAFLGVGSTVTPDVCIGKAAFVNAGTMVKKDIDDGITVAGYSSKIHFKNIYLDIEG